ncbi:MAG TPA: energy transducer TonB, partial [Kofleriaceae bacterium]|nr:energy transducer TonB [Kofleriaceae bacterium]
IPVCSMMLLGTPLAQALAHEKIPMPMTGDKPAVAPDQLVRIAGEKLITPDDEDKMRIQNAGIRRLVGAFKVCIDPSGRVEDVQVLRPTGLATYDQRIITEIRHWQYQPYLDDGEPKAVCTAATFIYSQR